jgi:hypothetical protein
MTVIGSVIMSCIVVGNMVLVCIRSSDESSRYGGRRAEYDRKLISYYYRDLIDSIVRFQTNKKRKRAYSGSCGDGVKESSRVLEKLPPFAPPVATSVFSLWSGVMTGSKLGQKHLSMDMQLVLRKRGSLA